jgi:hypothetical protein
VRNQWGVAAAYPQTVTLLDGDVRLFRRGRSRAWQVAFKIDGRWVRVSTKCRQLDDAKKQARELYVEYQVRQKNGLPVISKRFADVARLVIADMEQQLAAGVGNSSPSGQRMCRPTSRDGVTAPSSCYPPPAYAGCR